MSAHSYSRCWIHLIWGTLDREKLLNHTAATSVSRYLNEFSIEELMQLLKGSSSHWINANDIMTGKFAWGRGYGAFSISESNVNQVARYIAHQGEHHRRRTFTEELKEYIRRHGLQWKEEESR